MNESSAVTQLVFSGDPKQMNWFREDYRYADVKCPPEFTWNVSHERQGDELTTTVVIQNAGSHPYFTNKGSIGISFPLADLYKGSDICLNYCCHAHIFCGENTSYIMALRMGGAAPHLGMVLTEGSLCGYSIERDVEKSSNDRGCFWLHPSPKEFAPGEAMTLSWKIFPHSGKKDFQEKLQRLAPVIWAEAGRYVLYPGEKTSITIRPSFEAEEVLVNGTRAQRNSDRTYSCLFEAEKLGEFVFRIEAGRFRTSCRLLVQERPETLAEKRCAFIAAHQQYHGPIKELRGAYLAYDNEEHRLVYTPESDFNAARERMGMGVLMARFLCRRGTGGHEKEEASLLEYREFVLRELVDEETGLVCNDIGRDISWHRLYNYPWAATFFLECWKLWRHEKDLDIACRTIEKFYQSGGGRFYPIEMPAASLCRELEKAGWTERLETIKGLFQSHAEYLLAAGTDYPASEVNYEQSIVAPAADILLQVYDITGDEKYFSGAQKHIEVLELFNGMQPDYHLYETAIRHWDGYWFGKSRMYGDTFPHYWSAQTGKVFRRYAEFTGSAQYAEKAENSLRGVLSMFFADGTATCAYLFPYSVNGRRGDFADPYANDQDWGLCACLEAE